MRRERVRCSNCDKRRVVATWFHVGGVVLGMLFPVCGECTKAGWVPKEGRDYERIETND